MHTGRIFQELLEVWFWNIRDTSMQDCFPPYRRKSVSACIGCDEANRKIQEIEAESTLLRTEFEEKSASWDERQSKLGAVVEELQNMVNRHEVKLATYEEKDRDAVRRQIALTVEAEVKLLSIRALMKRTRAKYFHSKPEDEPSYRLINQTRLQVFEEQVKLESPRKYAELVAQLFGNAQNRIIFNKTIFHLEIL